MSSCCLALRFLGRLAQAFPPRAQRLRSLPFSYLLFRFLLSLLSLLLLPVFVPPITPTPGGWWDFVCSSCVIPTLIPTLTPNGFYGDSCLTHVTASFSRSASDYGSLYTIYKSNFSPSCANRPDHLYLLVYFVGDAGGNQLQVDVSFDSFWQRYYFDSFPIILQYDNVGYGQSVEVYSDLIPNSGRGVVSRFCLSCSGSALLPFFSYSNPYSYAWGHCYAVR